MAEANLRATEELEAQEDAAVQAAIQKASEKCVIPASVPLTNLLASSDPAAATKSARTKVMQERLAEAVAQISAAKQAVGKDGDSADGNSVEAAKMLGLQAAVAAASLNLQNKKGPRAGPATAVLSVGFTSYLIAAVMRLGLICA